MSHYKHHVFFCSTCCHGADDARSYAKERIAELGLKGQGKARVNKSGCLGRCEEGPVLVVYPEAVWYRYVDTVDVEEIIQTHLVAGRIVKRLQI
jgi:(2Fe-2S) ferredoxin